MWQENTLDYTPFNGTLTQILSTNVVTTFVLAILCKK